MSFVTGVSSCCIFRLDAECLLLGSSLVQYVLEVTRGREGVKILFFNFSTFRLDCFFVGGVVMIGIILDMFSCNLI